jgi:RNA polymerase subunit RPABC4/transcription elongation factor Spt4
MKCSKCGAENNEGTRFCGDCGKELETRLIEREKGMMKGCVSCGRKIEWDAKFCKFCGHAYGEGATGAPKSDTSSARGQSRTCVGCGRTIDWDANVCQYCGYDFRDSGGAKKGKAALAGGILLIVASALGLTGSVFNGLIGYGWYSFTIESGILGLFLFPMSIVGGALAITKRYWIVSLILSIPAVIASILLIIGWWFGMLLAIPALILGIIGLILIAISSRQFKN